MFKPPRMNPLIEQIESVFYNNLAERAWDLLNVDPINLDEQLIIEIQKIIIVTLYLSKDREGSIRLSNGLVIYEENCPNSYLAFFNVVTRLNNEYSSLIVTEDTPITTLPAHLANEITFLAKLLMSTDGFQRNISQLKEFILESKGITTPLHPLDETGITADLIRSTFYNEMINQTLEAINNSLLSLDDLKEEEPFIYLALSGLTLLEAIDKSHNCRGIQLLNNKVVNDKNCPQQDNFPALVAGLLKGKALIKQLYGSQIPKDEYKVIQYLCLSNSTGLPDALEQYKSPHSTACAAIINNMSAQISQSKIFYEMFPLVRQVCLETSEPLSMSLGSRLG